MSILIAFAAAMSLTSPILSHPKTARDFRPPAVPLVTHTPYFSVWSTNDHLTDDWTKHWTGVTQGMAGIVRVDGKPFRFMGPMPQGVPAMTQSAVEVHATRSVYRFEANGVGLEVEFLSPLLADDLDLLTRPVTYVNFTAHSIDGRAHEVEAYWDASGEIAVNQANQEVTASRHRLAGIDVVSLRSQEQAVLKRRGDNVRIDWGTFFLALPDHKRSRTAIGPSEALRSRFAETGELPDGDDFRFPRAAEDSWPVVAARLDFGRIGADPTARHLMLAYDEEQAIEYFGRKLPPYWKRHGDDAGSLLTKAEKEHDSVRARCVAWDAKVEKELSDRGGPAFAQLGALAYRQCLAAHGIVEDLDGTLLMFSKENFSNGCIGTVDVTYPGAPFFLHYNPRLLRAQIEPVLAYGSSPRWRFPFAPHDLGTYPQANGQVYGGGERTEDDQMPVEECGNMLLLVAALNDRELDAKYAPTLKKWADYLLAKGLDPENQLCTDDFAGHLAHNANLSLKAILAIGAYGKMANAPHYYDAAKEMAAKWMTMAADGDHTRLAFDRPGTWSQKYNLVWDRLLGLNLFPASLAASETAFYLRHLNSYGLPLDNREDYTKLDWCVWTATLATSRADFDAIVDPLLKFADESTSRVPLTDWYDTKKATKSGFQARSVVGGVFIPLLKPRP